MNTTNNLSDAPIAAPCEGQGQSQADLHAQPLRSAGDPVLYGLAAVADADARVLILGSMPGHVSLRAGQYYAHPRNAFWPIMGRVFGIDSAQSYAERLPALRERGVALWDVLRSCRRVGSLDSAIKGATAVCNDFQSFFEQHPRLRTVLFNGRAAEHYYRLHVLPSLQRPSMIFARLPSTSPAMASLSVAQKAAEWGVWLHTSAKLTPVAAPSRAAVAALRADAA